MKNFTVAIDMDGVIADFYNPAKKICLDNGIAWKEGDECDISDPKFWSLIKGASFWRNLPVYDHASSIFDCVKKYTDDYYILTKSGWDAKCPLGKTEWIQKHFPKELNRLWIIRGTKKYAANYNSFLIDDRKKNREEWVANGGYAFAWKENASKELANQLLTQLDDELYFAKHGKAKSV